MDLVTSYAQFRYWSPMHGSEVLRISMADERGREYWHVIPAENGRRLRERREAAVEAIMTAIEQKLEPGEVVLL